MEETTLKMGQQCGGLRLVLDAGAEIRQLGLCPLQVGNGRRLDEAVEERAGLVRHRQSIGFRREAPSFHGLAREATEN